MKNTFIRELCLGLTLTLFLAILISSCSKGVDPSNDTDLLPVIQSLYPQSAGLGDTVTVIGKNLMSPSTSLRITINETDVPIIKSSADSIAFVVPETLGSGQVVLSIGNTVYYGPEFTYDYKVIVTTVCGTGDVGQSDGPSTQATFNCPWGIAADDNGDLYIADVYNRLIRKFSALDSTISTIPIPSFNAPAFFASPYNIALDKRTHNLYVTDFNKNVMKVLPNGSASLIYSGTMSTTGIAVGPDDMLYMSNNVEGTVVKMGLDGQNPGIFANGLMTPRNIVFDIKNNMFVAGPVIYKLDTTGFVSIAAMDTQFSGWEIAVDTSGNFYEADHFNNVIKTIDKNGKVAVIAGNGIAEDIDGIGLAASFNGPQGLTIDSKGNLFVTTYNYDNGKGNKIRKITLQ